MNLSLEKEFSLIAMPRCVDIYAHCPFRDYLEPNEYFPEGVKPHLQWNKKGLLVSTGTERSFFDLLFSDETQCEGLVVCDINPRVKAYVDFNVLLLRISKTREEYLKLSTVPEDDQTLNERIKIIGTKINECPLSQKIHDYYLNNFKKFASIYLYADQFWRGKKSEYFTECRYDQYDDAFLKLQKYAQSGNIIAAIGDINDLTFLKRRHITILDTSNILAYSLLDLHGPQDFHPRIIWTNLTLYTTTYRSYIHEDLSTEEKKELNTFINEMRGKPLTEK